jgi:hypothetical protein
MADQHAADLVAIAVDLHARQARQAFGRRIVGQFADVQLRRSQLQDFPAQALAGIEIYKSGTADIIEPGLATPLTSSP